MGKIETWRYIETSGFSAEKECLTYSSAKSIEDAEGGRKRRKNQNHARCLVLLILANSVDFI